MTHARMGEPMLCHTQVHPFKSRRKSAFAGALAVSCWFLLITSTNSTAEPLIANVRGVTRSVLGTPIVGAKVTVHDIEDNSKLQVTTDSAGVFEVPRLKPGHYELTATKDGIPGTSITKVTLAGNQDLTVDLVLGVSDGQKSVDHSKQTGNSGNPSTTKESSDVPLTDRERALLARIERLEERLEAIEVKNGSPDATSAKSIVPNAPLEASLAPPVNPPPASATK